MLYNYIKTHYKQAEPIFLSDLLRTNSLCLSGCSNVEQNCKYDTRGV